MMNYTGLLYAGLISAASAGTIVDTDFLSPYVTGDLAGQQGWSQLVGTGAQAFNVDAGSIDTASFFGSFDSENGNAVILSPVVGNAVDDEWSGFIDFQLSTTPMSGLYTNGHNIADLDAAQEIFQIGLALPGATNLLADDDNVVTIHLRKKHNSSTKSVRATLSSAANARTLAELDDIDVGWDPTFEVVEAGAPDFETDDLRLSWTLRKTRVADLYSASITLSNLSSGVSSSLMPEGETFVAKSAVYAGSTVNLAMGHDPDADGGGSQSLINIAIDSLRVDQVSASPVLDVPVVSVTGGIGEAVLSWSAQLEADSYIVKRSTVPGGAYTTVATTNGTGYVDSGLTDGSLYYYVVVATANGSADAVSSEVSVVPGEASGLILDTHFTTADGYADGDLAGQGFWKAAVNTGPEAFGVIESATDGYADSAAFASSFDTSVGNAVYFNRVMANDSRDQWNGEVSFNLSTTPVDGWAVTNVTAAGVTNIADIAGVHTSPVFSMGLTVTPDDALDPTGEEEITILARQSRGGGLNIVFHASANGVRELIKLDASEIGWDPSFIDTEANAPDFETEQLTVNWSIRKTAEAGMYAADAEVYVGTNTVPYISSGTLAHSVPTIYDADQVFFGITHDKGADRAIYADVTGLNNGVDVVVDSIRLEKMENTAPIMFSSDPVSAVASSEQVALEWSTSFEASGYAILRSDTYEGVQEVVAENLTDLVYTNSGLTDGRAYIYQIRSDYGEHGSVLSEKVAVFPLASQNDAIWGLSTELVTASFDIKGGNETVVIADKVANIVPGTLYPSGAFVDDPAPNDYDINLGGPLFGIVQLTTNSAHSTLQVFRVDDNSANDRIRVLGYYPEVISALIYSENAALNVAGGGYSLELDGEGLQAGSVIGDEAFTGIGTFRAAVRNGSQWYVSNTRFEYDGVDDAAAATISIPDLAAEIWTPLTMATTASTAMMTVSNASFSAESLNNITATGFFVDHMRRAHVYGWRIFSGQKLSPLVEWASDYNLYNEDAASGFDYDGDGVNNIYEWGLGGNPANTNKTGYATEFLGLDDAGEHLVYVYPRLKNDPRPNYELLETGTLSHPDYQNKEGGYGIVTGDWPGDGVFEAVTNLVPVDADTKFIKLNISE